MGRTSTRKALSGHGYALLRQMGVAPSDLGLGRRGRPPKRKRGAKKAERPLAVDGTPIHYGNILLLARRGLLPPQHAGKAPQPQHYDDEEEEDEEMENDENQRRNANEEEEEEVDEAQALAAAEALVALVTDKTTTARPPAAAPCADDREPRPVATVA